MKKLLAGVAVLLSVAGCSQFNIGRSAMNPQFPQVSVVGDRYIVIDQEPIVTQRGATVTWQLPEGKIAFDRERGITVDALVKTLARPGSKPQEVTPAAQRVKVERGLFPCSARSEREFACVVPRDAKAGQYAYTVRVRSPAGELILDPTIIVEE